MSPSLKNELLVLLLWLVFMFLLGTVSGYVIEYLLAALVIYVIWNLYNLGLLTKWLLKPSKHVPETIGVWDSIYYKLYHLYQRQRTARRKLASIVTRFQESTQALPYATIVLNNIDEIEWFNSAASYMFNLRSGQDIGQRIDNLVRHPEFTRYIKRKDFTEPLEFVREQQRLLLNITPYGNGQYLLTARDVTQQSKLDEMRRDFIANASHELRTPITVISGYIEALRSEVKGQDRLSMPLDRIEEQKQRMLQMLNELMTLAKLESEKTPEKPDIIDVSEILTEIYNDALIVDNGKHNITLKVSEALIEGNKEELRMAFTNLVTNAIYYTPEKCQIYIYCEQANNDIYVGVEDKGIGITYEHISRLTERFYRVDPGRSRDQGGTGLGLAIVKHVLDRHGGKLFIKSTPGEGSLFRCDFKKSSLANNA